VEKTPSLLLFFLPTLSCLGFQVLTEDVVRKERSIVIEDLPDRNDLSSL